MVPYEKFMSGEDGLRAHLTNLLRYGFAIVKGVCCNTCSKFVVLLTCLFSLGENFAKCM